MWPLKLLNKLKQMPMNKRIVLTGLIMVIVLATGSTALAASNNTINQGFKRMNRQSIELTEEQKAELETKRAAMISQQAIIEKALAAGDYNAWFSAQQAVSQDCPMLTKVTKDNFSRYVESWRLRQQAQLIDQELGLNRGQAGRRGAGLGAGQARGRGLFNPINK
jgi:hypothetical protein